MASGKAILAALAVGGIVAAIVAVLPKKASASTDPVSPILSDIANANTIAALNLIYERIDGLQTLHTLTVEQYDELYIAYVNRWYQLNGAG